ncbi:uncharacterized protein LOC142239677 [Haematobia irritans]|uniref:Uncharacterized protein n=1 Tax=Haematobia irritans TaxID=7368 RepID=A0A1L8EI10_HAEIR
MPCPESTEETDVALQILDIVTPRHVSQITDPQVTRETTQTDQINKKLLTTFLERINVMGNIPLGSSNDDSEVNNFED